MKRSVVIVLLVFCAGLAVRAQGTNEPAATATTAATAAAGSFDERLASMEKRLLKKLDEIGGRLDQMARDQKTDQSARDRKLEQMQSDVSDIRRVVERLETKR